MLDNTDQLVSVLWNIGIIPVDIELYRTACIHRSYLNESPKTITSHNERLEFLWDAVLELSITQIIYDTYPDKEEWWMTDLRSSYVRGTHLASLALNFQIDTIIMMSLGEKNAGWTKNPNVLADAFEAIIWALFLDQWFDAVNEVVRQTVFLSDHVKSETKDAKSLLQEYIQQRIKITPQYTVIDEIGKDHEKIFTVNVSIWDNVIGTGQGTNKKIAQELSAKSALQNQKEWEHLCKK